MPRFNDPDVERIKAEVDLVRLVQESGVELRQVGSEWKGRCIFHDDHSPSLSVSKEKGLWRCWSCGAAGDALSWVMRRDSVSFRFAKELLRKYLGGGAATLPRIGKRQLKRMETPLSRDATDEELVLQVVGVFHARLLEQPTAQQYLAKRGLFDKGLIDAHKVGYTDRTFGYQVPQKAASESNLRNRLKRLGILRAETGHPHFAQRVVVPVFDETGTRVVQIYGRLTCAGEPRHMHLPWSSKVLWNSQVLKSAEEHVLCESILDALTFARHDFVNVVACLGTEAFGEEQLDLMKRFGVKRVLIAFDRDDAGDAGAARVASMLKAAGIGPFRIRFPHGMDANEYALKVQPAANALALSIQAAEWMGDGPPPVRHVLRAVRMEAAGERRDEGRSVETPAGELGFVEEGIQAAAVLAFPAPASIPPSPVAPPAAPAAAGPVEAPSAPTPLLPEAEIKDGDVFITIGDREYRIRGLSRNKSADSLRVSVFVTTGNEHFVDTIDLLSSRARTFFLKQASGELGVEEAVLKRDLGQIHLKLEALQLAEIEKERVPKNQAVVVPADRKAAAMERLKAPGLAAWVLESLDACGLVGERTNKLVAFFAAVSRLLPRPLGIIIQSSSSAGKSTLMDAVLAFMPPEVVEKYSALTGQALFYRTSDLTHMILALEEQEGASRATYALKLLQSEGAISIASTGKDPATGKLVTTPYKVNGPTMIIMPTTSTDVDEEFQNRCFTLTADETRAQTRAIHRLQRELMTVEGLALKKRRDRIVELQQDVQRLLEPVEVRIPYVRALTFADTLTRTRRDHAKYLTLIAAIALVHQHQRPRKVAIVDGQPQEYIEANLDDVALANEIVDEVLGRSLAELPPQTQGFLDQLDQMVSAACAERGVQRQDQRFGRRQVLDVTSLSMTVVRKHLQKLIDYEYVIVHQGKNGEPYTYELLYAGEARKRSKFVLGLIDVERLRAQVEAGSPGTSRDLAPLSGGTCSPLAPTLPPPCSPVAQGGNGRKAVSPKGSNGSGSEPAWKADPGRRGNGPATPPKTTGTGSEAPPTEAE